MSEPKITPQAWYDDNRERFGAKTTVSDEKPLACEHYLVRRGSSVECNKCRAGWIDYGQWTLKDGKIQD
jgi:hypothetical protein